MFTSFNLILKIFKALNYNRTSLHAENIKEKYTRNVCK